MLDTGAHKMQRRPQSGVSCLPEPGLLDGLLGLGGRFCSSFTCYLRRHGTNFADGRTDGRTPLVQLSSSVTAAGKVGRSKLPLSLVTYSLMNKSHLAAATADELPIRGGMQVRRANARARVGFMVITMVTWFPTYY